MTDAEKMREAAADICRRHGDVARHKLRTATVAHHADIWGAIVARCDMLHDAIRALPDPDASAPAADCQKAGLVTAGAVGICPICDIAGCYHIRERNGMPTAMQTVPTFTSANASYVPAGLLDEVKAALALLTERARGLVFAHHHGNGLEGWHNTVDGVDLAITAARAALARLEREVG